MLERFQSSRLWALILLVAVVVTNAMLDLGLSEVDMENVLWGVLGYMGLDTLRGSVGGSIVEQVFRSGTALAEKLPDVGPDEEEPVTPEAT